MGGNEVDMFGCKKVISLLSHYRYKDLSVEQTTQLRALALCKNELTKHNNAPDAHQGSKIFLQNFLWPTPIPIPPISLLLVVLGPLDKELHFQGGLHANYIMRIL